MPPLLVAVVVAVIMTAAEIGIQALMGGSSVTGARTLNRGYSTSTYGADIPRCRGTVRVPGNLIWATEIQETVYKAVSGSKGSNALYTYQYSCSLAVGFARGPASALLSLWADGKRMYTTKIGSATVEGTVTLIASATSPALQGSLQITVQVSSFGSLFIQAGTIIQWPGPEKDTFDYEVIVDVNLGPGTTGLINIWPPLQVTHVNNEPIFIPGVGNNEFDVSDFQVDPNFGHIASGGPRFGGAATVTVYFGSTTQMPDPTMEEYLGSGNVPGYRGLVYVVINQMQLVNFGNRIPHFTAEIAFDGVNPQFPMTGPVASAIATGGILLAEEVSSVGPLPPDAYVYILDSGSGTGADVYTIANPGVPGLQMVDAPIDILSISESGHSATAVMVGTSSLAATVGDSIVIAGVPVGGYNGTWEITGVTNAGGQVANITGVAVVQVVVSEGGGRDPQPIYAYYLLLYCANTFNVGTTVMITGLSSALGGPLDGRQFVLVAGDNQQSPLTNSRQIAVSWESPAVGFEADAGQATSVTSGHASYTFNVTAGSLASSSGGTAASTLVRVVTTEVNDFTEGELMVIAGAGVSGYDGTWPVVTPGGVVVIVNTSVSGLAASGDGTATRSGSGGGGDVFDIQALSGAPQSPGLSQPDGVGFTIGAISMDETGLVTVTLLGTIALTAIPGDYIFISGVTGIGSPPVSGYDGLWQCQSATMVDGHPTYTLLPLYGAAGGAKVYIYDPPIGVVAEAYANSDGTVVSIPWSGDAETLNLPVQVGKRTSGVVTLAFLSANAVPTGIAVGVSVTLTSPGDSGFNGTFTITAIYPVWSGSAAFWALSYVQAGSQQIYNGGFTALGVLTADIATIAATALDSTGLTLTFTAGSASPPTLATVARSAYPGWIADGWVVGAYATFGGSGINAANVGPYKVVGVTALTLTLEDPNFSIVTQSGVTAGTATGRVVVVTGVGIMPYWLLMDYDSLPGIYDIGCVEVSISGTGISDGGPFTLTVVSATNGLWADGWSVAFNNPAATPGTASTGTLSSVPLPPGVYSGTVTLADGFIDAGWIGDLVWVSGPLFSTAWAGYLVGSRAPLVINGYSYEVISCSSPTQIRISGGSDGALSVGSPPTIYSYTMTVPNVAPPIATLPTVENVGWESSNAEASAGYDFANFDAAINAQLGTSSSPILPTLQFTIARVSGIVTWTVQVAALPRGAQAGAQMIVENCWVAAAAASMKSNVGGQSGLYVTLQDAPPTQFVPWNVDPINASMITFNGFGGYYATWLNGLSMMLLSIAGDVLFFGDAQTSIDSPTNGYCTTPSPNNCTFDGEFTVATAALVENFMLDYGYAEASFGAGIATFYSYYDRPFPDWVAVGEQVVVDVNDPDYNVTGLVTSAGVLIGGLFTNYFTVALSPGPADGGTISVYGTVTRVVGVTEPNAYAITYAQAGPDITMGAIPPPSISFIVEDSAGASSIAIELVPVSPGGYNTATPSYVFSAGYAATLSAPQLMTGASVDYQGGGGMGYGIAGYDVSAFPFAFMTAFQTAWRGAINAALEHIKAASYASKVAYVRVGGGLGGGWYPCATAAMVTSGQISPPTMAELQATWAAYMQAIANSIVPQSSGLTIVLAFSGGGGAPTGTTYAWADAEASIATTAGFDIGAEEITGSDIAAQLAKGNASGGSATTGFPTDDSAYLFSKNKLVALRQVKESGPSDPTGVAQPGSLLKLLPYATGVLGVNAIELYYNDFAIAYDPSNPQYATYGAAYRLAIQAARPLATILEPSSGGLATTTNTLCSTTTPNDFGANDAVIIAGAGNSAYDGQWSVSLPGSPTVRLKLATSDLPASGGGTATRVAGGGGGGRPSVIYVTDPSTMTVIISWEMSIPSTPWNPAGPMAPELICVGHDGYVYALGPNGSGQFILVKYDALTGEIAGWVGFKIGLDSNPDGWFDSNPAGVFVSPTQMVLFDWLDELAYGGPAMRYFLALIGDLGGTLLIDRAAIIANEMVVDPISGNTYDVNQAIIGYDPWVATGGEDGEGAITGDPGGQLWLAIGNQLIAYAPVASLLAGGTESEQRQMTFAMLEQTQGGGAGTGGGGGGVLSWTPFSASARVSAAPIVACKCTNTTPITLTLIGQESEVCYVVNTGGGLVSLVDSAGAPFGVEASYALPNKGQSVELSYSGGQWWVLGSGS